MYALGSTITYGPLASTDPELHGLLVVEGVPIVGVYTSPFFDTAVGYSPPHRMFATQRFFRVVIEFFGWEAHRRTVRRRGHNVQAVFPETSLVPRRIIILPNEAPMANDNRFYSWDPRLELLLPGINMPIPTTRILPPPPPMPVAPKPRPPSKPTTMIPRKCGVCNSRNIVETSTGWRCNGCTFEQALKSSSSKAKAPALQPTPKVPSKASALSRNVPAQLNPSSIRRASGSAAEMIGRGLLSS